MDRSGGKQIRPRYKGDPGSVSSARAEASGHSENSRHLWRASLSGMQHHHVFATGSVSSAIFADRDQLAREVRLPVPRHGGVSIPSRRPDSTLAKAFKLCFGAPAQVKLFSFVAIFAEIP